MKALVLAAGFGTRLGSLTKETPKPMLPVEGRPLLEYTIRYLAAYGFDQIAVNLHFMPEVIQNYFGDGSRFGVELTYSYEEELLGTAGAVRKLENFFADSEDFLVIYGDILTDQDLGALVDFHRKNSASATLVLHERAKSNSLVRTDDAGRILDFIERPTEEQRAAAPYPWVNSGIQILTPKIIEYIPQGEASDLPRNIYTSTLDREKYFGFPLTGYRCAIDSQERYEQACAAVRDGSYSPKNRK